MFISLHKKKQNNTRDISSLHIPVSAKQSLIIVYIQSF